MKRKRKRFNTNTTSGMNCLMVWWMKSIGSLTTIFSQRRKCHTATTCAPSIAGETGCLHIKHTKNVREMSHYYIDIFKKLDITEADVRRAAKGLKEAYAPVLAKND